jgi:hypothetical protein
MEQILKLGSVLFRDGKMDPTGVMGISDVESCLSKMLLQGGSIVSGIDVKFQQGLWKPRIVKTFPGKDILKNISATLIANIALYALSV